MHSPVFVIKQKQQDHPAVVLLIICRGRAGGGGLWLWSPWSWHDNTDTQDVIQINTLITLLKQWIILHNKIAPLKTSMIL